MKSSVSICMTLILCVLAQVCAGQDIVDLSGSWSFQLDETHIGERERWFEKDLRDNILADRRDGGGRQQAPKGAAAAYDGREKEEGQELIFKTAAGKNVVPGVLAGRHGPHLCRTWNF